MKDWFLAHYIEIRYWEMVVTVIIAIPIMIAWIVLSIKKKKRK